MICSKQSCVVCDECWANNADVRVPSCFWCNSLSDSGKTCKKCVPKTSLNGAVVGYRYKDLVKECIYELKYYSNREMARFLARQLAQSINSTQFDFISFVPTTGRNQRRRGYNQARLLAKEISSICQLPLITALVRTRHVDQIGLKRSERLSAIKNNFIAIDGYCGKRILLVDDVITTGATLNECAQTLKRSGVKNVRAVVVAKK